jgi:hypothetical protein
MIIVFFSSLRVFCSLNFPTYVQYRFFFSVLGCSWYGVPAVHPGEPARYKSLRCLRLNPGRPAHHTSQETDVEPPTPPPPTPQTPTLKKLSSHISDHILHTKTSQFQHFLDAFVQTDNLLGSVVDPDPERFA